jgi:hypothetical protein
MDIYSPAWLGCRTQRKREDYFKDRFLMHLNSVLADELGQADRSGK